MMTYLLSSSRDHVLSIVPPNNSSVRNKYSVSCLNTLTTTRISVLFVHRNSTQKSMGYGGQAVIERYELPERDRNLEGFLAIVQFVENEMVMREVELRSLAVRMSRQISVLSREFDTLRRTNKRKRKNTMACTMICGGIYLLSSVFFSTI
ncbi:hypothetical protein CEXT_147091 [Caerostris extrusa]|uniref:Uncharacterized protein n=1 Tax=Caerostris extrusa TaxID=172846 RepID=A0AAV4Y2B5_CAEEX|nr:hypothetical protein CEXT_147091 [Caerostris extrusa]